MNKKMTSGGQPQEITLSQILEARDRRAQRQQELLSQHALPLISFSMNIAGPIKNGSLIRRAFKFGSAMLTDRLSLAGASIIHAEEIDEDTGCEGLYVVDMEPDKIKKITQAIEEAAPAGRLYDMDVLTVGGIKIDRSEPRKCLICDEDAHVCGRNRTHTVEELQAVTNMMLSESLNRYDAQRAASLAVRSLLYEVCVTPKPGLVDRTNSGSHSDMDIYTFMSSASSLFPFFEQCVLLGRSTADKPAPETLAALREPGIQAEISMRRVTDDINTHKGAIYSMGLVCGALGRLDTADWKYPELVADMVADMAAGTVERELKSAADNNRPTAGQRIYAEHGITGIRGEVEAGFPTVLKYGLPVLEAGLGVEPSTLGFNFAEDRAGSAALLAMLTKASDTNMISRGGMDLSAKATGSVKAVLKENDYPARSIVESLDSAFISDNLSPGGSADLLSVCWMLHFLKSE